MAFLGTGRQSRRDFRVGEVYDNQNQLNMPHNFTLVSLGGFYELTNQSFNYGPLYKGEEKNPLFQRILDHSHCTSRDPR